MLSSQLIKAQGIDVLALFFETPFFSSAKPKISAASLDLPFKVIDLTKPHFDVVKDPKHGYGGNLNPCIDCHALMIRHAGDLLEEEEARFIVTGEVLGQRPMSQNKQALSVVAKESGYPGLILRPLSAKRLPITIPEEKGWVDREKLMDFSGRSRKPQMALARELGVAKYPTPAGGCLLTDPRFSRRLKDLISANPFPDIREIELLKLGRHFRINPHSKLIVGRNKQENEAIRGWSRGYDYLLSTEPIPGPTALILGEASPEDESLAAAITASYSDANGGDRIMINVSGHDGNRQRDIVVGKKKEFKRYMVE